MLKVDWEKCLFQSSSQLFLLVQTCPLSLLGLSGFSEHVVQLQPCCGYCFESRSLTCATSTSCLLGRFCKGMPCCEVSQFGWSLSSALLALAVYGSVWVTPLLPWCKRCLFQVVLEEKSSNCLWQNGFMKSREVIFLPLTWACVVQLICFDSENIEVISGNSVLLWVVVFAHNCHKSWEVVTFLKDYLAHSH